jgi:streptogramin lyase
MSTPRTFVGRAAVLTGIILWMCAGGAAYAQEVTEFEVPSARSFLLGIAAGPDGSLWFTEWSANKIGRITTDGVITEFKLPGLTSPGDIASGSDGSLWFTRSTWSSWENGGPYQSPPMIGRITTAGVVSEFPIPHSAHGIVAGPDGALWFGEEGVDDAIVDFHNLLDRDVPHYDSRRYSSLFFSRTRPTACSNCASR